MYRVNEFDTIAYATFMIALAGFYLEIFEGKTVGISKAV